MLFRIMRLARYYSGAASVNKGSRQIEPPDQYFATLRWERGVSRPLQRAGHTRVGRVTENSFALRAHCRRERPRSQHQKLRPVHTCVIIAGSRGAGGSHNGSAAVLKTAVRKDMQVRVLSPPPFLFNNSA